MSISALVNNITSAVRGIGQALDLIPASNSPKYNLFPNKGINNVDQDVKRRWFAFEEKRYVFSVVDDDKPKAPSSKSSQVGFLKSIVSTLTSDSNEASGPFGDFALPITPQEISQIENFAVKIKPTQGGTTIHHDGNKYKDLVISGTTGVAPFRGITGVDRFTGNAIAQPDDLKYRSGYEVFIHFRNWIKSYHETKAKGGAQSRSLRMIFKNFKDWEFLIVEPLKFTMKRDASKPLLYNYTIQFRVLGHQTITPPKLTFLEQIDRGIERATQAIQTANGIFKRFEDIIRSTAGAADGLIENLRKATLAVKAARGIQITLNDVPGRIIRNFLTERDALFVMAGLSREAARLNADVRSAEVAGVDLASTVSDPVAFSNQLRLQANFPTGSPKNQLLAAIQRLGNLTEQISADDLPTAAKVEISREQEEAALVSKFQLQEVAEEVLSFQARFTDALGLSDETVSALFGFTSTATGDEVIEITDEEYEVLYAFALARTGLDALLSNDELFDTNRELFKRSDSNSGADTVGQGIFPTLNPDSPTRVGIVPFSATLEEIALVELGDTARWTEIAELNGLKAPYIDNSAETNKRTNYVVRSSGFFNPVDIQGLLPTDRFIVAASPTPAGAWTGKANFIAEYLGSDPTLSSSWRFIFPYDDTVAQVQDRKKMLEFVDEEWREVTPETLRTSEVLKPGDFILIPSSSDVTPSVTIRGPRDNPFTRDLSEKEKSLAVDLKLNEQGDLDLTPSGDLNISRGAENGAQAIVLKLLINPGELKKHPELGTQIRVGGKIPDLADVRTQILTTLLQDDRILDVRNINLFQQNSSMEVSFDVFFRDIQEPVPITIPI